MNKLRLIYASTIAAKLAVLFVVVITIWAELAPGLKNWLKSISGHHWTTKSYLTMLLYVLVLACVYNMAKNVSAGKVVRALNHLVLLAFGGAVILIAFFIWHS